MVALNERAWAILLKIVENKDELKVRVFRSRRGAILVDAGVEVDGSIGAGLLVSKMLLSGLGDVNISYAHGQFGVQVLTDSPIFACLASQYAGWRISVSGFFGMCSGPGRLLGSKEELFDKFQCVERGVRAVLFIETSNVPPQEVVEYISDSCGLHEDDVGIVFSPSNSLVGSIQVPARVVETGIHKLMEIGYDVRNVKSALGFSPIPPVGESVLDAIGKLNDAIIYGGKVVFYVDDLTDLSDIIKRVPSDSSDSYGLPFSEVFKRSNGDFYSIDPLLFSPAEVSVISLRTGRLYHAGRVNTEILEKSFR